MTRSSYGEKQIKLKVGCGKLHNKELHMWTVVLWVTAKCSLAGGYQVSALQLQDYTTSEPRRPPREPQISVLDVVCHMSQKIADNSVLNFKSKVH
jgi:hypothetical protein